MTLSKPNQITFPISGMHCVGCAETIQREATKVKGVQKAYVNYATESAVFEVNESFQEEVLKTKLKEIGYSLGASRSDHHLERARFVKWVVSLVLTIVLWGWPKVGTEGSVILLVGSWVLSWPLYFWVGWDFLKALFVFMRRGVSNMNTLIGLGTSAAFWYSSFVTLNVLLNWNLGLPHKVYFEAIGFIITFVFLGKWLEEKAKRKAKENLTALLQWEIPTATIFREGQEKTIPVEEVQLGDQLLLYPGDKVPVDGVVLSGESYVDESMLTGESQPILKKQGFDLISGTLNQEGKLIFKATKVGAETTFAQILNFVEKAQLSKAEIQKLADRISQIFVPVIIVLAFLTLVIWWWLGSDLNLAISNMISVLVIACPCALGLATPIAVVVATTRASKNGILISGGEVLEKVSQVNHICFDKTGTLTQGRPEVEWVKGSHQNVLSNKQVVESDWCQKALALSQLSKHPLSQAIAKLLKNLSVDLASIEVENFQAVSGKGLKGKIQNEMYFLGSASFLKDNGWEESFLQDQVGSYVYLGRKTENSANSLLAIFFIKDQIKSEAQSALSQLKEMGYQMTLLSGDVLSNVKDLAQSFGMSSYHAQMMPVDKASYVEKLQDQGDFVAMVGDGMNDSPALVKSHLSIAMGGGSDMALKTSDVVLMNGDLTKLYHFFKLSSYSFRVIKQNLFLSFIYNILCIPIAAGVLYPFTGWWLPPGLASLAMGLSSVSVVLNSLKINRFKL